MSKFYETDKFKRLQKKWQDKLKKSGFEDKEESVNTPIKGGNTDRLKTWSSSFFRGRFNQTQYEARAAYYRFASQFLHDHAFDNPLERAIWEHHSNGISTYKMVVLVNKSHTKIHTVITKLAKLMWKRRKADAEADEQD